MVWKVIKGTPEDVEKKLNELEDELGRQYEIKVEGITQNMGIIAVIVRH